MKPQNIQLLRFTTAGSVDDGKSTLIGRLLYDSKSIFQDQIDAVEESSKNKGFDYIDLSDIFVRGHIYLPAMKGKFGLKDILLAIDPEHEFGQLSGVKNGLDASKEYMNYYYSDSESERSRLKTELSKYVNLDTKGIYDIYTYILNLTN